MIIRTLGPGDEPALETFLLPRIASSMFLVSNLRDAGILDLGQIFQGTYAAAFDDGQIVAVVAHYWNGNLVLQAPDHLAPVMAAAIEASGHPVRGLIGPDAQVAAARDLLGLAPADIRWQEQENLYVLALDRLVVPGPLQSGRVRARRMERADLGLVIAWRVAMNIESLGEEDTPRLWDRMQASVERSLQDGRTWLLEDGDDIVSTCGFNAALAEAVQIGGVWTPPELRRRGYARAVVAGALLDARAGGVSQAILFTGQDNLPAQKAYAAIGFQHTGDYRLLLLRG